MNQQPQEPPQKPLPAAHQRKLVTIRPITELRHLKGGLKRFDMATARGGWNVLVGHDELEVNDLVLYFEIDSFISAEDERFSWEDSDPMIEYQSEMGYRVRSKMYGKNISQGRILGIKQFPEVKGVLQQLFDEHGPLEGTMLAQEMAFDNIVGVKKWKHPIQSQDHILGPAPIFFHPPGCERAQNLPDLFTARYLDHRFQVTEKVEGALMTVYRVRKGTRWHAYLPVLPEGSTQEDETTRVGVASRTEDLEEAEDSIYWRAAKAIDLTTKIHRLGFPDVAVQGELIGPTIKNNSLGFAPDEPHQFFVFQIYNINSQRYMDPRKVVQLCQAHGLPHVPIVGKLKLREFATNMRELLAKADGVGCRGQTREGLVLKLLGDEFAFKVISNKWLLEHGE